MASVCGECAAAAAASVAAGAPLAGAFWAGYALSRQQDDETEYNSATAAGKGALPRHVHSHYASDFLASQNNAVELAPADLAALLDARYSSLSPTVSQMLSMQAPESDLQFMKRNIVSVSHAEAEALLLNWSALSRARLWHLLKLDSDNDKDNDNDSDLDNSEIAAAVEAFERAHTEPEQFCLAAPALHAAAQALHSAVFPATDVQLRFLAKRLKALESVRSSPRSSSNCESDQKSQTDLLLDAWGAGRGHEAILLVTALLDRACSDAFAICAATSSAAANRVTISTSAVANQRTRAPIVPKKLRLVLASRYLRRLLGDDVIFILQALAGPIQGLNLRNLAWHGFLADSDTDLAPALVTLLVFVVASLTPLSELLLRESKHRPPLVMLKPQLCPWHIAEVWPGDSSADRQEEALMRPDVRVAAWPAVRHLKQTGRPQSLLFYNDIDPETVRPLIDQSFFVIPTQRHLWCRALLGDSGHPVAGTARADISPGAIVAEALSVLFPLLEHSLRRVFAAVNFVFDRLWTAESDTLYSTLDIILGEVLPATNGLKAPTGRKVELLRVIPDATPSNCGARIDDLPNDYAVEDDVVTYGQQPNALFTFLGAPLALAILDVFKWFEGPRLRDQLSHGALDTATLFCSRTNCLSQQQRPSLSTITASGTTAGCSGSRAACKRASCTHPVSDVRLTVDVTLALMSLFRLSPRSKEATLSTQGCMIEAERPLSDKFILASEEWLAQYRPRWHPRTLAQDDVASCAIRVGNELDALAVRMNGIDYRCGNAAHRDIHPMLLRYCRSLLGSAIERLASARPTSLAGVLQQQRLDELLPSFECYQESPGATTTLDGGLSTYPQLSSAAAQWARMQFNARDTLYMSQIAQTRITAVRALVRQCETLIDNVSECAGSLFARFNSGKATSGQRKSAAVCAEALPVIAGMLRLCLCAASSLIISLDGSIDLSSSNEIVVRPTGKETSPTSLVDLCTSAVTDLERCVGRCVTMSMRASFAKVVTFIAVCLFSSDRVDLQTCVSGRSAMPGDAKTQPRLERAALRVEVVLTALQKDISTAAHVAARGDPTTGPSGQQEMSTRLSETNDSNQDDDNENVDSSNDKRAVFLNFSMLSLRERSMHGMLARWPVAARVAI